MDDSDVPLTVRAVERSLAGRYSTYIDEVHRFVRAGMAVMEREQTTSPRVGDIVSEAGLSYQAFYKHFRSKTELLLAIMDEGQRELVSYLQHQMNKERSGVGKIQRWLEGICSQAADPSAASATRGVVLNSLELRDQYPEQCLRLQQLIEHPLADAIRQAQEEGAARTADPEQAASMIYRLTVGLMEDWLISRRSPGPADIRFLTGFVLQALGSSADGVEPKPLARSGAATRRARSRKSQ